LVVALAAEVEVSPRFLFDRSVGLCAIGESATQIIV
jgi:hypothetical protein